MKYIIRVLNETFAVCQLTKEDKLPQPPPKQFWSLTCTEDERSLVCNQEIVPPVESIESGWKCIKLVGPLAFDQVGILASFSKILADAAIPIYVISTYNTDYLFVKNSDLKSALNVLINSNLVEIES